MLGDEIRHVVDDACDYYKRGFTGGTTGLELIPGENGELRERKTPVEGGAAGVEGFLLLLKTALLNLVVAESLEVIGEARFGKEEDDPFCGVVLVPGDGVACHSVSGNSQSLGYDMTREGEGATYDSR